MLVNTRVSKSGEFLYVAKKVFATMDFPPDSALLEARLIREIASVDRQIHELQTQRRTLEILLLKARREGVAARAITRRNSVARILIEDAILDALRISKRRCTAANSIARRLRAIQRSRT